MPILWGDRHQPKRERAGDKKSDPEEVPSSLSQRFAEGERENVGENNIEFFWMVR